ncbi:hypothetical protein [Lysobacter sp. GCM10012299]|uniref:hypothetical protein n=1 Tax=Lysobacter sp. GCM10012299 TaxID=3317333 RepID=UPI003608A22B
MSTKMYKLSVATLVLLAALAMLLAGSFGNRTRQCLEDPSPGDLYMARIDALRGTRTEVPVYGVMRVEEVYPDRIMAHPATHSSASKRRAYRDLEKAIADEIAYDMSRSIEIARDDLLGLHARGIIVVAKDPGA